MVKFIAALRQSYRHTADLPGMAVRLNGAALIESGGLWLMTLLAGIALIAGILIQVLQQEIDELRISREQLLLVDLRDRIEADLGMGFELENSNRAQVMIEESIARDASLYSIDLFDATGKTLYGTDRGSIGALVAASWVDMAGRTPPNRMWRIDGSDGVVIGMSIRSPYNDSSGDLALRVAPVAAADRWRFLMHVMIVVGALLLLAPPAVIWALRGRGADGDDSVTRRAADRLLRAQARMQVTAAALRDVDRG